MRGAVQALVDLQELRLEVFREPGREREQRGVLGGFLIALSLPSGIFLRTHPRIVTFPAGIPLERTDGRWPGSVIRSPPVTALAGVMFSVRGRRGAVVTEPGRRASGSLKVPVQVDAVRHPGECVLVGDQGEQLRKVRVGVGQAPGRVRAE